MHNIHEKDNFMPRAISKKCMEITQDTEARDECHDCFIDHEYAITGTVTLHIGIN
jgi:hypothetical protein